MFTFFTEADMSRPYNEEELKELELTKDEQIAYNNHMAQKARAKKKKKAKKKQSKNSKKRNR